jgi:YrbI family 3-deoxy-D-manno-octulosonate 8-phosphate phosphatase
MIENRFKKIKLLILDVDGVLTDGRIIMDNRGEEVKSFNVRDGQGLRLLQAAGIEVAIITGRRSGVVEQRARDLGIREVHQGVDDKAALCMQLIRGKGLERQEVCSMGDDLTDIPLFGKVGLGIAVHDAATEVREAAHWVTENRGGRGAVREVCERILKAQDKWDGLIAPYLG